jgi:hypothetical protein
MEPATSLPNHKAFERSQGRVIVLAPAQSHTSRIELAVHTSTAEVGAMENRIGELQNRAHPLVHERPIAKFSPT